MLRLKFALCVSFIGNLALTGCSRGPQTSVSAASTPVAPVREAPPAAPTVYLASGPLVVENQVDVAAQREGLLAKVLVDVDAHVRKGQLLALLDDRQLRAERDAAAADLRASEANLKNWEAESEVLASDLRRDEEMWKAQLITEQQLEHSRYKLAAAKYQRDRDQQNLIFYTAKLHSMELELAKTQIQAPFDGVVARRYVREGQKVGLGDRLFWVTATGPLNVKFALSQDLIEKMRIGRELEVSAPFLPGPKHTARITQLSPVVDPASGTIEVQARLLDPPGNLRPGMTVNVRIKDE